MDKLLNILQNINKVFIGKEEVISKIMTNILCGGHLLIEIAGVGKTNPGYRQNTGCSFSGSVHAGSYAGGYYQSPSMTKDDLLPSGAS